MQPAFKIGDVVLDDQKRECTVQGFKNDNETVVLMTTDQKHSFDLPFDKVRLKADPNRKVTKDNTVPGGLRTYPNPPEGNPADDPQADAPEEAQKAASVPQGPPPSVGRSYHNPEPPAIEEDTRPDPDESADDLEYEDDKDDRDFSNH